MDYGVLLNGKQWLQTALPLYSVTLGQVCCG